MNAPASTATDSARGADTRSGSGSTASTSSAPNTNPTSSPTGQEIPTNAVANEQPTTSATTGRHRETTLRRLPRRDHRPSEQALLLDCLSLKGPATAGILIDFR